MSLDNGFFIGNVSFQRFILFIFIVIFTFFLGALVNTLIIRLLKNKVRPGLYKTISKIAMYGIYAAGLFFAFAKIINLNIPAGLAALGVLGIGMILPAVPVMQNIASGIVLAFERPFREDDILKIDGKLCKVKDIMLRKTRLRSIDGEIITVPNLIFMTSASIINYSKGQFIRVSLDIDTASDTNIEKVKEIIKKICFESPNILPNVPEKKMNIISRILSIPKNFFEIPRNIKNLTPQINIKSINKDKISIEVWFWIWDILTKKKIISSFYEKLSQEFKKDGIKFG